MTSKVVVGPQISLEERLVEAVRAARTAENLAPIYIVVPSNLLAVWLRRQLARQVDGLLNVRLLTFVAFARELTAVAGGRRPLASRIHEIAAVREALAARGGYFEPVSGQSGLHLSLADTIQDLDNGAISAEDLDALAMERETAAGDLARSDASRLRSLSAIARRRAEAIRPAFETARELLQRAEHAAAGSSVVAQGTVLVYGFHDFTELQVRVLARIAAHGRAAVFLSDEKVGRSPYLQPALDRLRSAGLTLEQLPPGESPNQRLAAALFLGAAGIEAPVHFTSAPSELVEVQEVARQVMSLLEAGVSPDVIAIVHHGAPYPRMLAEVLERAKLKFFLASSEYLADTRYGKSILLLLDLVGSPMRRAGIMEFVSFAPLRETIGSRPGNWEWISRRAAIVEGESVWRERLGAYIQQLERELGRVEDVAEEKAWLPRLIADTRELRDFALQLFQDLSELNVTRPWSEHVGQLRAICERYFQPDSKAAATCLEALEQLRDLDHISGPCSFDVFREALRLHFADQSVQEGQLGRGHIFLGRPRDIRGMRYQHLFVVGLVERSFPPPPSVDSTLLERERRSLTGATRNLLRGNSQILNEERLLFANLVGSSGQVYLSFPRFEMERARPRYASPFYLAAAEAMTGTSQDWKLEELPNHHRVPDSQPDPTLPVGSALWVEELDLALVLSAPEPGPREWTYLDASSPHFRRLRNAVRCRSHSRLFTRYDGLLRKPESSQAATAYVQGRLFSATALETYATCPQRFFMKHVLRVEALDEPENVGELSPLERGTIIHEILERFYDELAQKGELPLRRERAPDYRDLLESIAGREFVRAEERGVTGHLVGWKAYRRRLLEDLVRFLENELDNLSPDLVPTHFEFEFGRSLDSPPVLIKGEGGLKLAFGGRIDRIDSGPGRARVIDYKSGKTLQARHKDNVSFAGGEQLQLPIYLLAAAQALGLPEEAVDAAYFHVNRQVDFRTVHLRGENFRTRRGQFNYLVSGLADHIQRGVFVPQTDGGTNCRYCDFKTVCAANVQRQQERKQEDPNLAEFLHLKDIK